MLENNSQIIVWRRKVTGQMTLITSVNLAWEKLAIKDKACP